WGRGEAGSAQRRQGGVERRARAHGRRRQRRVGEVVAADVDRPALHRVELVDDRRLVGGEPLGQRGEAGGQGRVVGLGGQRLRPVERQVELAAPVVELAALAGRRLGGVEQLAGGLIQGVGQDLGPGVAGAGGQQLAGGGQSHELDQRVPA